LAGAIPVGLLASSFICTHEVLRLLAYG
jgi:hypothetical protein